MTAEPPTHPTGVWVIVNGIKEPRSRWAYLLTEEDPSIPRSGTSRDRGISTDKLCCSYTELSAWLLTYGFTPPPPEYFAPTPEELTEGADWIVRRVTRPR